MLSRETRSELYAVLSRFWGEQAERLQCELPQVVAGEEAEALHRFRVALRRSRSLLKLFRDLLPEGEWDLELLDAELGWLGAVTGAVRDLDVLLIETRRREVAALQPLIEQLEAARDSEQQALRNALTSNRFGVLLRHWLQLIAALPYCKAPPPAARVPLRRLLPLQLLQQAHWLLKHGSRIDAGTPATQLHRLRIRAKRLRYLIETFPEWLPERGGEDLRRSLIALQDLLGAHQDAVATGERLTVLRTQMSAPTVVAIDAWVRELAVVQRQVRAELMQRLLRFAKRCDAL